MASPVFVRLFSYIFSAFIINLVSKCNANDILGCGGFVKSHVNLDFSKIEIGLYSKDGSLKEKTECAPTNGYYFLPIDEKGDYVLQVHPPAGWSFEPSEVKLSVDGVSDQCSTGQDINFSFDGFGITGKVITSGQKEGPGGITVQLVNDDGDKRETLTTVGGDFHFTPVIPGKYTVKASHPRWKLEPSQASVQVKEGNTVLPVGVLAVKGYDVKGSVTSFGSPISGIYVLLYPKSGSPKFRVEGCNTALLQGVPDAPICHSVTDASGEFTFSLVPAGEYKLLALSKPPVKGSITYNIKPESVPFSVKHDSLFIKNAFEVTGFTIQGSLVASASGPGIAGARVTLAGQPVATTDADGQFTLTSLQPGVYTVAFQHEECEVDPVELRVSASGVGALRARAARWRLCGDVTPPATRQLRLAGTRARAAPAPHGKFCIFLEPGEYTVSVDVSEQEQRDGLQYYPVSQKITVTSSSIAGVSFSQLKGRLSGHVQCGAPMCRDLTVALRPLSPDGGYVGEPVYTDVKDGQYTFSEVLPGSVEVSVPGERLCWAERRHNVAVTRDHHAVPAFRHSGYALQLRAAHDIEVEYSGPGEWGTWAVPRGLSGHCVTSPEPYRLTPRGCHIFDPPTVNATPGDTTPVKLVASAHALTVSVVSPVEVDDLVLRVSRDGAGAGPGGDGPGARDAGPLAPVAGGPPFTYEHTLYLADGEIAVVTPWSSQLLFSSSGMQVVGRDTCGAAPPLRAVRALTLAGALRPPAPGARVTVTADDGTELSQITGEDGRYSFGPLDASRRYVVAAQLESYVFGEPDEHGDIAAHRLADITIQLVDDADDTPLEGALVSVSGGSFRRNVASPAGGRLRFPALAPAQYYVKPRMKEYRFSPPHHVLAVRDGRSHDLLLKGTRVAWSCIGRLVSVAGAGRAGATVVAAPGTGTGDCTPEEAVTDQTGAFRIRGLLPECVYTLTLKESDDTDLSGLKLVKAPAFVEVKEKKDIQDVLLIAVQPNQITDANVLVYTPQLDHYKTLRLTLAPDNNPNSPLYSTKLDPAGFVTQNPGLMYVLPRLPADNKTYVLQIESSLSKATHVYKEQVLYFTSDGHFKYFNIEFLPTVKSSEQELRQSSLVLVPALALLALAAKYRTALVARLTARR